MAFRELDLIDCRVALDILVGAGHEHPCARCEMISLKGDTIGAVRPTPTASSAYLVCEPCAHALMRLKRAALLATGALKP